MNRYLDILSTHAMYGHMLLRYAFEAWLEASDSDRAEYADRRRRLVIKFAGAYWEKAKLLTTSGSTCGIRKKYKWGPCFDAMFTFFEWLKFRWFDPQRVYYLKLMQTKSIWTRRVRRYDLLTLPYNGSDRLAYEVRNRIKEKRIVLWLMPSYARHLINTGFRFEAFNPQDTIIYSSGEGTPPEVSEFFTSRGYHYIDAMRCWTGGCTFITCQYGRKHWIDLVGGVKVGDDSNLIATDYFNLAQAFVDYDTGDRISWSRGDICKCDLPIDDIKFTNQKSLDIGIGSRHLSYQDLFNMVERIVATYDPENRLVYCSFGIHNGTRTIVVYYDPINQAKIDDKRLAADIKKTLDTDMNVISTRNHRSNLYKISKVFELTDRELGEVAAPAVL